LSRIGTLGDIPYPRIPSDLTNQEGIKAFFKAMQVIRDHLASLGFMVDKPTTKSTTSSASLSSLAKAHGVSKEALAKLVKKLKAQEKRKKGKDSNPGAEEKKKEKEKRKAEDTKPGVEEKKKKRKAEDSNPGGGEKKNKKKKASDDDDDE